MSTAIATRDQGIPDSLAHDIESIDIDTHDGFSLMQRQARMLIQTGFLPSAIKTPEQAIMIMMKGQELRVGKIYALTNIVIINGKPCCSSEMMLALIRRDHRPQAIRVGTTTNDACTVQWRQPGWPDIQEYTFTIQDAERAGLFKNAVWKQYPAAMLRARCISAVARMAFPECIAGMFSPDELGAAVAVTDEGEVVFAGTKDRVNEDGESFPILDDDATDELKSRLAQESEVPQRQAEHRGSPPPRTIIEQQPQQSAKQRETQSHETAMKRLHAIGRDAGFDHDDLHKIMTGRYDIASLKDASAQMLDDMATFLDGPGGAEMYAAVHPAATTREQNPEEEVIAKISAAGTQPELQAIRKEAEQNGMLSEAVKAAGNARRTELNRQERGELGGMPSDVSRYANA